jgi:hypothetical protein
MENPNSFFLSWQTAPPSLPDPQEAGSNKAYSLTRRRGANSICAPGVYSYEKKWYTWIGGILF